MKNTRLPILVLGLAFAACQPSEKTTGIQQIQDQVMVVHDEVMPKTDELMELKEKISHHIDSLSKITPATENLKNRQQEGTVINKSLTEADSLMMDWMHHYNADTLNGMEETQAKAYLDQELTKINSVKEKINGGITEAKKFLGN